MSTVVQNSDGQYAQGLVLAQMQELSPIMADFLDKQNKLLVSMSNASMASALSSASNAMGSALAQAGANVVEAGASGVTASSGMTMMKELNTEKDLLKGHLAQIDQDLEAAEGPACKFKKLQELPPAKMETGEEGYELQVANEDHSDLKKKTDTKKLKREREKLMKDHEHKREISSHEHGNRQNVANAVQYGSGTLFKPIDGSQQKGQQTQQGLQNIENQAAQQAETGKEQSVSTWTSLIQGVGEVQGYTSSMAR
jgi:hypothetical protein